jgi:hypothetical protein
MQAIEIISESEGLSLRQRWANVFTILVSIFLMLFGLNLRNQVINASVYYASPQAGISANYPQNWLLDTSEEYVFRVRDLSRTGFKTTFQVAVRPVGDDAVERNIADRLTLDRLQTLTDYRVQPLIPYPLPDGSDARAMYYSFTSSDSSPFLQAIPAVVEGLDILAIRGGQAIIISYRADASLFDEELPRFENFLRELRF